MKGSGLYRYRDAVFESDGEQARRSAKANLSLMLENRKMFYWFPPKRGAGKSGEEYLEIVERLSKTPAEQLTDKQCSYIADVYDRFMKVFVSYPQ